MKVNLYFLIAGIISVLSCFTHAWNGTATVLPLIDSADFGIVTKTAVFYVWHIISIENLIFGIALIIMALYNDLSKIKSSAWMIAIIIAARWGVIFGSTLLKDISGVKNTLIDSAAIFIFIGLIISGIKRSE